ncbi:hypothetical protein BDU57DRAFT_552286 [Ampelomyces quisqualis]|uniref:AA1-like domain-containing protein n=1 Tax=Ampelomyces quisqualis TaxID=50730 RepID=A0A6A5Q8S4_AMPQU|nr:hypothetical protein BDU57DRAFT_552286 [Ampelomyces quisqualis]
MQFTTEVIALFSALAMSSHATDVYSTFLDEQRHRIGKVNFDLGNSSCFSVDSAHFVKFSQFGLFDGAKGPYCLHGFYMAGCPTRHSGEVTLKFPGVVFGGSGYPLLGVAGSKSFRWTLGACPVDTTYPWRFPAS